MVVLREASASYSYYTAEVHLVKVLQDAAHVKHQGSDAPADAANFTGTAAAAPLELYLQLLHRPADADAFASLMTETRAGWWWNGTARR
jgi:hypothetical protein